MGRQIDLIEMIEEVENESKTKNSPAEAQGKEEEGDYRKEISSQKFEGLDILLEPQPYYLSEPSEEWKANLIRTAS